MRKNSPLISVILPVYNAGRYVGQAIESILGQTLGDFELIVIDDGSTVIGRKELFATLKYDPAFEAAEDYDL